MARTWRNRTPRAKTPSRVSSRPARSPTFPKPCARMPPRPTPRRKPLSTPRTPAPQRTSRGRRRDQGARRRRARSASNRARRHPGAKPDASPLEVAQHFRSIRDALEQCDSENVASAQNAASQARSASAPVGAESPEQVGAALRAAVVRLGSAAATAKVNALYDALPKDMVAPWADIAAKAKAIQAAMLPEHSALPLFAA